MEYRLKDHLGRSCRVFLHDVSIFSKDVDTHFKDLNDAFIALRKQKLKVKLTKCSFLRSSILFLGFKISKDGISPDPIKLRTTDAIKSPTNVSETRSILGLFNYLKSHVDKYAVISKPINQ